MPKTEPPPTASTAEGQDAWPKKERIKYALGKLRRRDRIGVTGEYLSAAGGAAAGATAAGAVASAAGVTSIWGATTVVGALGGVFVAATPVGWVIGTAVVGAIAGIGIARLVRSGARQDARRKEHVRSLEEKLYEDATVKPDFDPMRAELQAKLDEAVSGGRLSTETANRLLGLIQQNALDMDVALDRVRRICEAR